jgi:hypothetical protein
MKKVIPLAPHRRGYFFHFKGHGQSRKRKGVYTDPEG